MSLDEWATYHKVQAIKRQNSKSGKCAEKVNADEVRPTYLGRPVVTRKKEKKEIANPIGRLD